MPINYPSFSWFFGIVEDRGDPEMLGRVRVRIHGYHTENKTLIPTNDLPWAIPMQPITSGAINGIGTSPTGLLEGSLVMGFFTDGEEKQQPVIVGSIAGLPQTAPNKDLGFNDPNEVYPKNVDTGEDIGNSLLEESDVNRLARNHLTSDAAKSIVQKKKDDAEKGVATADGGEWDEPETPYAAVYPKNHVTRSESGHVIEVDDTPDAERLHTFHKSGTFEEIHPDGIRVTKVVASDYLIVQGTKNVYIENNDSYGGSVNVTIQKGDVTLNVEEGNMTEYINGNVTRTITGNLDETIGGSRSETIAGSVSETISGSQSTQISGNLDVDASRIDLN